MSWGGGLARGFYPPIDDGCSTHPSSDSKSVVTNGVHARAGPENLLLPRHPAGVATGSLTANPSHYTFYRSEGRGYRADNGPRAHSLPSRIGNAGGSGEVRKPPRGASSADKAPVRLAPLPKLSKWTVDDKKGHRIPPPPSSFKDTHGTTYAGITTKDHENLLSRHQKFATAWAQARAENHRESPVSTARGSESSSPRRAEQAATEHRKARATNSTDRTQRSKSEPAPPDRSGQVRPSRPSGQGSRSSGPAKSPDKAKSTSPSRFPASQNGEVEVKAGEKEEVKAGERERVKAGERERVNDGERERVKAGERERVNDGERERVKAGERERVNDGERERVKAGENKSPPGKATSKRVKSSIKFNDQVLVLGETKNDRSPSKERRTHHPSASPRSARTAAEEEREVLPYHPAITDPHVIYRTYTGLTKRELQLQRIDQQEAEAERAKRAEVGSQYSKGARSIGRTAAQDRSRKRAVLREGEARLYLSARSVYRGDDFRQQRKSRFLHRLEKIQKEVRKYQTEEEKQRMKLWDDSRRRQKNQLLGVRKRFQKQQVHRFRTQYVTSRVLEHEYANRHNYGLPEDFSDNDDDEEYDDDDDDEDRSSRRTGRAQGRKSGGGRRTRMRKRTPSAKDTEKARKRNERLFEAMVNINRGPAWDRSGTPKMEGIDIVTLEYTDNSGKNVRRKREASDVVRDAEELLNGDGDELSLSRESSPSSSPKSSKKPRPQPHRSQSPPPAQGKTSTSTQRTTGTRPKPTETSRPSRSERPPWNMGPDLKQDSRPGGQRHTPHVPKPKLDFSSSSRKPEVTHRETSPSTQSANSKPPRASSNSQQRTGAVPKTNGDRSSAVKSEHSTSEKPIQQTESAVTKGDRGDNPSSRHPAKSRSDATTVNSSKDDKHSIESNKKGHQKPDDKTLKQDSVSSKQTMPTSLGEKSESTADKRDAEVADESKKTQTSFGKDASGPEKSSPSQSSRTGHDNAKKPTDSSEAKNTSNISKEPVKHTVKPEGSGQRERTDAKPVVPNKQTYDSPHAKERQAAKLMSDSPSKPKPTSTKTGRDMSKHDSKPKDSQTTASISQRAQELNTQQTSKGAQPRDDRRVGPRYVVRPKSQNIQSRPQINSDRTSKTKSKPEPVPDRDNEGVKKDPEKATKTKPKQKVDPGRRVSDRTASKQSEKPGAKRGGEGRKRDAQAQKDAALKAKAPEVKKPALDISNRSKHKASAPAAAPLYLDDSDDDADNDDVDIFERARLKYGLVIESDDDDDDLFDKSRR